MSCSLPGQYNTDAYFILTNPTVYVPVITGYLGRGVVRIKWANNQFIVKKSHKKPLWCEHHFNTWETRLTWRPCIMLPLERSCYWQGQSLDTSMTFLQCSWMWWIAVANRQEIQCPSLSVSLSAICPCRVWLHPPDSVFTSVIVRWTSYTPFTGAPFVVRHLMETDRNSKWGIPLQQSLLLSSFVCLLFVSACVCIFDGSRAGL